MLTNYLQRLIELQDDRYKFQKERDKNTYANKINKQQSKYHAYIIDQMNQKNKIIAANKFINILQQNFVHLKNDALKHIHQWQFNNIVKPNRTKKQLKQSQDQQKNQNQNTNKEEINTVQDILLKFSLNSIERVERNNKQQLYKIFFNKIKNTIKKQKIINKLSINIQKYYYRHALKLISKVNININNNKIKQNDFKTQVKIFDEEFSEIYKNQKNKCSKTYNKLEQSYLSFILQKQKQNIYGECLSCKQSNQINAAFREQIANLKKQLSFIKILLSDKTLELKKKIEECEHIRNQVENRENKIRQTASYEEYSECNSKNSSYYNELQRQVLGGKRIRKNGQKTSQVNISMNKLQVSKQLLGKYMRESFQLKQKIDIACQICTNLQQRLNGQDKKKISKIIKVLMANCEQSFVDQL